MEARWCQRLAILTACMSRCVIKPPAAYQCLLPASTTEYLCYQIFLLFFSLAFTPLFPPPHQHTAFYILQLPLSELHVCQNITSKRVDYLICTNPWLCKQMIQLHLWVEGILRRHCDLLFSKNCNNEIGTSLIRNNRKRKFASTDISFKIHKTYK